MLPAGPLGLGRPSRRVNLLLFAGARAVPWSAGSAAPGSGGVALLVLAALLGVMVVLPIGGADMPVVISLLNALTGLSAAAAGVALENTAMIVAGMIVGASGSILTDQMAVAMNRSMPAIVGRRVRRGGRPRRRPHRRRGAAGKSTTAADAAIQMAYAAKVIVVPGYGMAVAQAQHAVKDMAGCWRPRAWRSTTRSTRSPAGCRGT